MNNFLKTVSLMAVILLVVGVIGSMVLRAFGADQLLLPSITGNGVEVTAVELSGNAANWSCISAKNVAVQDLGELDEIQAFSGDIKDLVISIGAVNFKVIESDQNRIVASKDIARFVSTELDSDGTLRISNNAQNRLGGTIVLYLSDNAYDTINLIIGACTFESNMAITANELNIDCGAGNAEIENWHIKKATNILAGGGNCELEGKFLGEILIECGVGNIDIKIDGNQKDYGYKIDGGLGNITIGKNSYSGLGFDGEDNLRAENTITATCGAGNIDIQFTN